MPDSTDPLNEFRPFASLEAFVPAIRAAIGIRDGARLLLEVGNRLGMPTVAFVEDLAHPQTPTDEAGNELAPMLGWPEAFVRRWLSRNYSGHHPVFLQARHEHLPFIWSVHDPKPPELEDWTQRRSIVRELAQIGLTRAIVVPIHRPLARVSVLIWFGDRERQALAEELARYEMHLHAIGLYFFGLRAGAEVKIRRPEAFARLSLREIACLTLIAGGNSDEEAAHALGLSLHTVRFHLGNAAERLGAKTRAHAVALALQLGIIGPVDG